MLIVARIVACAVKELRALIQDLVGNELTLQQAETRLFEGLMGVGRTVLTEGLKAQAARTPPVVCPGCAQALTCHRRPQRTLITLFGEVRYQRGYYYCRAGRKSQKPLGQQWGLDGCGVTKALREVCALLGAQQTFESAAKTVKALLKFKVCPSTLYRHAQRAGQRVCVREELERRLVEEKRQPLVSVSQAPEGCIWAWTG